MKTKIYSILILILITCFSCTELDLFPVDTPTSAPFVSRQQFREALNEGYRPTWFPLDLHGQGADDDSNYRFYLSGIKSGVMDANYSETRGKWSNAYKIIARMLSVKQQITDAGDILSATDKMEFIGEADFFIASVYGYLVTHYGDVPYYDRQLSVDEAFEIGRTDKNVVLNNVYDLFDSAIAKLPATRSGNQFISKGAAIAMKSRIALHMNDWAVAAEAAEAVMDLELYDLHPNFGDLFLVSTKTSPELIFHMPRDESLNSFRNDASNFMPRSVPGGYAARGATWELLASFECTDGKPIDESPLFDRENPFKNRDPRCGMTIVPFGSLEDGDGRLPSDGTRHMGVEVTTHPSRLTIMDYVTGEMIKNNDVKSTNQYSNFHGLLFKKGVDEDWLDRRPDPNYIIIRYADVLLTYAEAKIELGEIDASVLKAINDVRDRAYAGSGFTNPAVTTTDQSELRQKVRLERRVELSIEGLRYMDLVRWRLAEKAFTRPLVGLLSDGLYSEDEITGVVTVKPGLWFWSEVPEIDEDGFADFQPLIDSGFASEIATMDYPVIQYLYPVPQADIDVNANLLPNNDGY